jgi:NAD+ diphosphatase
MAFVPAAAAPAVLSARPLWFAVQGSSILVRPDGEGVRLPSAEEVVTCGLQPSLGHYLGRSNGQDCFAIEASAGVFSEPWHVEGLRSLHERMDEELFAVAVRAVQIAHFGATHRFCGRCATATLREPSEHAVRCPACNLSAYPRLSPAIIVLVRRGPEALLAHSARFTTGFYSTLAGFVEPGESLEQTLVREVHEEVGIAVADMRYFGSQPWPFPHSLMLGFTAQYAGGEIVVDGSEITDARWFRADALPPIPPKISIARRLIDAWVSEVAGAR